MSTTLRKISYLLAFLLMSVAAHSQYWMQSGGSLNVDEAYDVAVDPSGNSYATGYFTGTATFGTTNLTSSGSSDIFVVKYNNSGVFQWAVNAGGSGTDRGLSIDVDGSGNVYVTGFFNSTASFGNQSVTSAGQQDVFIAKYSSAGTIQWVERCGGTDADIGNGICVDNSGNAIVAGEFKGQAGFGLTNLTSLNASTDVFITKLSSNGSFVWTQQGAGQFSDRALDVGCDGSGNVYATGQFSDTITFDNSHSNTMFNAIFVVKLNSSGVEQWFRIAGGGNSNIANAIDVSSGGNAYITGDFTGNLTFFGSPNTTVSNSLDNGVFVTKYSSAGAVSWASKSGSNSSITSQGIAIDNSGSAHIIGHFECSFEEYTDVYGEAIFNSVGFQDIYVSKFSGSGSWSWAKQFGGRQQDYGYGIGVKSNGQAHIAGSYKNELYIPTSTSFNAGNLNNWTAYSCGQNSPYCNDASYGEFHGMNSAGNSDAVIANCVDPNREPYDYYMRSGSGCYRGVERGCINTGCPDSVTTCYSAALTAIPNTCANIGPIIHYGWLGGGNTINKLYSSSGYKWVEFSTQDGCFSHRDSIYVNQLPGPTKPSIEDDVVINQPTPYPVKIELCSPDTVLLTASNFTVDTFYWTGPNLPSGGLQDTSISVSESGTYSFTVVDNLGCSKSTSVIVEFFDPLEPFNLKMLKDDTVMICEGESFEIMLYDSVSNPTASPVCLTNLQPNFETNITYSPSFWLTNLLCETYLTVYPEDTGWFHITASLLRTIPCDTDSFVVTDSIYVITLPLPTLDSINLSIEGSSYYCPGESSLLVGTGNYPFIWSGPGVNGNINDSVYVNQTATYIISSTIQDTNQYGCTASLTVSASKLVQVKPQPQISSSSVLLCPNDTVWLTATNTGATEGYFWEGPNGTIPSDSNAIPVSTAGTYYVIVNDADSCDLSSNSIQLTQYNTPSLSAGGDLVICEGDSLTLNVISSSGSQIEWLPPLSGSGTQQTIYEPGTYTCKITSCDIETYATIQVFPSVVESEITPHGILCLDSHIILTGSPGMDMYEWSSSSINDDTIRITEPGTYTLTTTDSNGCSKVSDPVTIDITQEPTMISVDGYPVFCYDDSITLYGNSNMVNYLWLPPGDTTQDIVTNIEGQYTLKTTDTNGCRGVSDPLTVSIPDTNSKFNVEGDLAFCEGDSVKFRARRGGMKEYYWLPDSTTGRDITFYASGIYSLFSIDTFGCEAWSDTIEVYMQPNNINKPIGDDTLLCMSERAQLHVSVNIGNLKWSKAPYGNVINEGPYFETPNLYLPTPYYVWSDYKLCRGDTTTILVDTKDCFSVLDPNIFTPNGDGINEIFTIALQDISCLEMFIYNRWGVLLYEGEGIDAGWDGTNQRTGKPAAEGTYYYLAHYCRYDGEEGDLRGYITLIRE